MNRKLILGPLAGLVILAVAACGGDDEGGAAGDIRIQKGLAVANLIPGGEGGGSLEGGAPAVDTDQAAVPLPKQAGGSAQDAVGYGGGFAPEPFPYPFQQASNNGITVQGYASASADADSAIVEFFFSTTGTIGIEPLPYEGDQAVPGFRGGTGSGSSGAGDLQAVDPITEADLQAVIDAIVAAGVAREEIEFLNAYADPYSSSATLRATVNNVDSVDTVVQAATDASAGVAGVNPPSTSVSYTISDCAALETAAMKAAVEDANERATAFSQSLGVGLGSIVGASNYSSYFGDGPCDSGFFKGPYPVGGISYFEGQPREVQVYANISVTYAIQ